MDRDASPVIGAVRIFYDQWLHAIASEGIIELEALAAEMRGHFGERPQDETFLFQNRSKVPTPDIDMLQGLQGFDGEVLVYASRVEGGWHVSLAQLIDASSYQAGTDTTYFNAHENGLHMIRHAIGENWRRTPEVAKQGIGGMPAEQVFQMAGLAGSGMTIVEIIEDELSEENTQRHQRIVMTRAPINTDEPY